MHDCMVTGGDYAAGDVPPAVWVSTTLSLPLTWCLLLLDQGRSSSVSGCARAARSGTAGSRVTTIRLLRGAQGIRLARLARPVRSRQGRRDPDPAPPSRCAPAAGRGPQAVVGGPGGAGRAGPATTGPPAPAVAPDRLPANPAALARQPGPAEMDVPASPSRTAAHRIGHPRSGAGDSPRQPFLGLPGASRASWPGWATRWRRRPFGRSSRTRASTPRPHGAGTPGGRS